MWTKHASFLSDCYYLPVKHPVCRFQTFRSWSWCKWLLTIWDLGKNCIDIVTHICSGDRTVHTFCFPHFPFHFLIGFLSPSSPFITPPSLNPAIPANVIHLYLALIWMTPSSIFNPFPFLFVRHPVLSHPISFWFLSQAISLLFPYQFPIFFSSLSFPSPFLSLIFSFPFSQCSVSYSMSVFILPLFLFLLLLCYSSWLPTLYLFGLMDPSSTSPNNYFCSIFW